MTHKPLRYFVSSALLAGSLSAGSLSGCGSVQNVNEAPPNPQPAVNEAASDPEPNEHAVHPEVDVEPESNVAPEPEPAVSINEIGPAE